MTDKRFIESTNFPTDKVNEASAKEKAGGGRPEFWEMVFWWTRKPLASARAFTAGALLPENTDVNEFIYRLRLPNSSFNGITHKQKPLISPSWQQTFKNAKILDPFAGFGSIPLEAIRLGVGEVVASDLLPTAYVFLKAVLEYPKWIADKGLKEKVINDLQRWGNWIIDQLKNDLDIKDLYDADTAVYIGTWEVKCPHCGKWTPLVGNWWLARVSKSGSEEEETTGGRKEYSRLAWMEPIRSGYNDKIGIRIIDLNKELDRQSISASVNSRQGTVKIGDKEYRVPQTIDAKRETATCLYCNNQIRKGESDWYVREALRDWNKKLEEYLTGQIDLENLLNKAKARPRLLVKVKVSGKNLEFEPATDADNQKLWNALEKLKQIWGDLDIPIEPVAGYDSRSLISHYGFDKWFKFFNPRQLLTLVKLVKLIREAGKKAEEEKLREGWNKDEAYKYAEAIITYLAIALCKFADFNSVATRWNPGWLKFEESLSVRGIAMMWSWTDSSLLAPFTGTWKRNLENINEGISYLISAVSGSPSKVRVVLDDTRTLSKLDGEKFDAIITDPPYLDDIPYTELSDFYYVWLKRVLSDVYNTGGIQIRQPRFIQEAFFNSGLEIEIQWKYFADKEISKRDGRAKYFGGIVGGHDYFKQMLSLAFAKTSKLLKDDGILVTYYAHTSPEAWEALLEAGKGTFRITSAHAIMTESTQRVTARGTISLASSIVVSWRKVINGKASVISVYEAQNNAINQCVNHASSLIKNNVLRIDLFVGTLSCVLSEFTKYETIVGIKEKSELVKDYIYPTAAKVIINALSKANTKALGADEVKKLSEVSQFYLLSKVLIEKGVRQERRSFDKDTLIIMSIGTHNDIDNLKKKKVIKGDSDKIYLLEPPTLKDELDSISTLLQDKEINKNNPKINTALDMLHLLEYYAVTLSKQGFINKAEELRNNYNSLLYDEAITLANILCNLYISTGGKEGNPFKNDIEFKLIERILASLSSDKCGILKYLG